MHLASTDSEKPDSELPSSDASTIERIRGAVRASLSPNGRYLIAVSGGGDSIVLMDAVSALQEGLGLTLHIAHVNHNTRETSLRDQTLVEEYAKRYRLPFHLSELEKCPSNENFESWARMSRYNYFSECLVNHNLESVLLAHHVDDQLETYLMRLLTNKEPTTIPSVNTSTSAIRPLLSFKKSELMEYAKSVGLEYHFDESNDDNSFLRNRVRNLLLPKIEQDFGIGAVNALIEQGRRSDALYRDLDQLSQQLVADLLSQHPFGSRQWLRALKSLLGAYPESISKMLLRRAFRPIHETPLGTQSLSRLYDFLLSEQVAVQLPGRLEIRRRGGGLSVCSLLPVSGHKE